MHGCTHSVNDSKAPCEIATIVTLLVQMLTTMPIGHGNNDGKRLFSHQKAKCYKKRPFERVYNCERTTIRNYPELNT